MLAEKDFFSDIIMHWMMMDWDCGGSKTFIDFMDGNDSHSCYSEGERSSDIYFLQRGNVKELIDCFEEMIWLFEFNDWGNER